MAPGTLIIRADASVNMGTGHVMRCLALAQAWQGEGGDCIFALAAAGPSVEKRLRTEQVEVFNINAPAGSQQDAAQLVELAGEHHASWAVVDGYQFSVEYQHALKSGGLRLVVLDDTGHSGAYVADVVLDQNAHAAEKLYQQRETYTRLLLGSRYSMLRREFKPWREWKREIAGVGHKVLVTMGGSDPQNHTLLVIQALQKIHLDGFEARIIVGGSNPHVDSLQLAVAQGLGSTCLVRNVTNMPELMAWADVGVAAAGSAAWELAFMGLPTIFTISAEHQQPIADAAQAEGTGTNLGSLSEAKKLRLTEVVSELLLDAPRRREMAANGRRLVDGAGADRVVAILTGVAGIAPN